MVYFCPRKHRPLTEIERKRDGRNFWYSNIKSIDTAEKVGRLIRTCKASLQEAGTAS